MAKPHRWPDPPTLGTTSEEILKVVSKILELNRLHSEALHSILDTNRQLNKRLLDLLGELGGVVPDQPED